MIYDVNDDFACIKCRAPSVGLTTGVDRYWCRYLACLGLVTDVNVVVALQEISILEEVMEEAVYALGDEAFGVLAQVQPADNVCTPC